MLREIAAVLPVILGLSACTSAYGEEILNLELNCKLKFYSYLGEEFINKTESEERFSIINNTLETGLMLNITSTEIYGSVPEETIPVDKNLHLQSFELDRFTGELRIKAIGPKMTYGKARIKEIGRGKCNKLDPTKKLF